MRTASMLSASYTPALTDDLERPKTHCKTAACRKVIAGKRYDRCIDCRRRIEERENAARRERRRRRKESEVET